MEYALVNGEKYGFFGDFEGNKAYQEIEEQMYCDDYCLIADFIHDYEGMLVIEEKFLELRDHIEQVRVSDAYSDEYMPRREIKGDSFWLFRIFKYDKDDPIHVVEAVDFEQWYNGIGPVQKYYIYTISESDLPKITIVNMFGEPINHTTKTEADWNENN